MVASRRSCRNPRISRQSAGSSSPGPNARLLPAVVLGSEEIAATNRSIGGVVLDFVSAAAVGVRAAEIGAGGVGAPAALLFADILEYFVPAGAGLHDVERVVPIHVVEVAC